MSLSIVNTGLKLQTLLNKSSVKTQAEADQKMFDIGNGLKLWYQTWGNKEGIPVIFVHGGPGNCVADYAGVNANFFDKNKYFVVEVDQRGTGKSTPSVRDDYRNMKYYMDITIDKMAADFELIRKGLNIEKWLVFGGSWGSTLGIQYAQNYPSKCLGLIVRGIFINTVAEFDQIYARKSFENEGNERRLKEFDVFFEPAANEAKRLGQKPLDPNDSERFIRLYEKLIIAGDRNAIWRFHVFENNLVEEDPTELLDPLTINEKDYLTAISVAFFECRLFLKGTFEEPLDLVGRLDQLKSVRTWVVQGTGDEVCPEKYAEQLVEGLKSNGVIYKAHFIDAGHKSSSDGMKIALKGCVEDFYKFMQ